MFFHHWSQWEIAPGALSPKLIELWHWNLVKCLIFKKACRKVLFHRLWAFSAPVGAIFDHFWLKRPIFRVSMATSQALKSNFLFKIAQACWTSNVASYRSSLGQKRTKMRDLEPFSCCHDAFWEMPVAMVTRNWTGIFLRKPTSSEILLIRPHSQNFSSIARCVSEIRPAQGYLRHARTGPAHSKDFIILRYNWKLYGVYCFW